MKVPIEINIDMVAVAKALKTLPRDHARDMLQDFLAELDTDSYLYAGRWIDDNPIDPAKTADCPRCGRTSYRIAHPDLRVCEYCRGKLP